MAAAVHWGVLDARNCLFIAASRIACIELAIVQLALLSVLICPEVASERVRAALRSMHGGHHRQAIMGCMATLRVAHAVYRFGACLAPLPCCASPYEQFACVVCIA